MSLCLANCWPVVMLYCLPVYICFVCSRLVHSGRQNSQQGGADVLSFGTRSGTRNGVEVHIFRVETQRDLAFWSRALVQGSHGAVASVKEVTCGQYFEKLLVSENC